MRRPLVWAAIAIVALVALGQCHKALNHYTSPPPVQVDLTPVTIRQRPSTGTLVRNWYFRHSVIWAWFERDFALIAKARREHSSADMARNCAILGSNIADTTAVRPLPERSIDAHLAQAMKYFQDMLSACVGAENLDEAALTNVEEYYNLGHNQMHWADQLLTPYLNGDI